MREAVWNAFQWLQTDGAYPNGPQPAALCHVYRAANEGWLPKDVDVTRILVVGPGSHHEVDLLVSKLGQTARVTVLTAYEGESYEGYGHVSDDVHDTDLPSAYFDLIFSSNVFEHVFAPYVALMECRRLLRKGGYFYAIVPTFDTAGGGVTPWHISCLAGKHWSELLNKTGFVCERIEHVGETLEGGALEMYFHIRARAVDLQEPHAEVMRRLIEAKESR